jgi:hypothetical protein
LARTKPGMNTGTRFILVVSHFPGFNVSPGDSITFAVWEGDANCNFGFPNNVGYGCFSWVDNTSGFAYGPTGQAEPLGYGTFTGKTCEGVIERQRQNNMQKLARWSSASMLFDCYDYFGGIHNVGANPPPFGEPFLDIKMVNGSGTTLASAFKTYSTADSITFTWSAAQ